MHKLANTQPKRLFTFGCSFTGYTWTMWPELLQYEFACKLYNYGVTGASNHYIAKTILEADQVHQFKNDDLILICWTSLYRQETIRLGKWLLSGSLDNNPTFTPSSIVYQHDNEYWQMASYSLIKSVDDFLAAKKVNYNMFSIQDLRKYLGFNNTPGLDSQLSLHLVDLYSQTLNKIAPSYNTVLYSDNLANKQRYNIKQHFAFRDYHPLPLEHLNYFERIFGYTFADKTKKTANQVQQRIFSLFDEMVNSRKVERLRPVMMHELCARELERILKISQYNVG